MYGDAHANFLITLNGPHNEPPLFLPRTLGVLSVAGPSEAHAYLRRHHLPLEGFALPNQRPDIAQMAIAAGAVRLAHFGELQNPPLTGDHGGHPRISEFVRLVNDSAS